MTPGRNDPCPCGSGKKYKKCCLRDPIQNDKFKYELSCFYGLIKNINHQLMNKANKHPYSEADFADAMDLAITSNGLSLIKAFFQENYNSITNILNMRNIIEHYVLLLMDEAGDIQGFQKELFNEQYKVIEYRCYKKGDLNDHGESIDRDQLEKNYDSAKNAYIKFGFSHADLKEFSLTPLPFLCDKKVNFSSLISKYLPECKDAYLFLSKFIHPSTYLERNTKNIFRDIIISIFKILSHRYADYPMSSDPCLPFHCETKYIYGESGVLSPSQLLYDIHLKQCAILWEISQSLDNSLKKNSYTSAFFREFARVLHDINTDSQLGFSENPKLKFKTIAEMIAFFHKLFFLGDEEKSRALYLLTDAHEIYKNHEWINQAVPPELLPSAYGFYKAIYPDSTVSFDEFCTIFKRSNGYLINKDGKAETLFSLVKNYINVLLPPNEANNTEFSFNTLYTILYYESQNMSHGCGYLYFANQGAWSEDVNVISFVDLSVQYLLNMLRGLYRLSAASTNADDSFACLLEKKCTEMSYLIQQKKRIIFEIPRVQKPF